MPGPGTPADPLALLALENSAMDIINNHGSINFSCRDLSELRLQLTDAIWQAGVRLGPFSGDFVCLLF